MCVLDDKAPPGDVVNTVARIMAEGGSHQNPHELLGTSDIDRYTHSFIFITYRKLIFT